MISNPRIEPIVKGYSFFDFIDKYCLGETSGLSKNRAFHRLCSLMRKMHVKIVVIEDLSPSYSNIVEECEALKKYHTQDVDIKAYRMTF